MTYAGLKSMIYAGLTPDDPRVKAALDYITKHYTLDENPGLGQQGLYYYYQTFAKALALLGKPTLVDAAGKAHDWRAELVAALAKRQDAERELGQPGRPLHGRRPEPRDLLRPAGPGVCPAEEVRDSRFPIPVFKFQIVDIWNLKTGIGNLESEITASRPCPHPSSSRTLPARPIGRGGWPPGRGGTGRRSRAGRGCRRGSPGGCPGAGTGARSLTRSVCASSGRVARRRNRSRPPGRTPSASLDVPGPTTASTVKGRA